MQLDFKAARIQCITRALRLEFNATGAAIPRAEALAAPDAMLATSPLITEAVAEHTVHFSDGATRPVRLAPQLPLAFLVAFEALVTVPGKLKYLRHWCAIPPSFIQSCWTAFPQGCFATVSHRHQHYQRHVWHLAAFHWGVASSGAEHAAALSSSQYAQP